MIPTVNNFLCCFGLETGGFIIGWLSAGSSVILGIFCAFAIAAAVKLSHHDDTEKKATVIGKTVLYLLGFIYLDILIYFVFSYLAVIFSVFLAYSIFLLFASIQMICGISNVSNTIFLSC